MKNRRNIVELKYPPENPNDIWLKDGKFYRSTSEGWVVIDSKTEYTSKESMIADKPEGGTIGIDKETGETSIYNDVAEQWSPLSGGGVTSITWKELKDKRDAGKLIPGALYRITDYQCTTIQENTQSAGHQFDIVLLALSENKLAEEGWAMMHDNDVYDVTFLGDNVTIKCYIYKYMWYDPDDNELALRCNIVDISTLLAISHELVNDGNIVINEENKTATYDDISDVLAEEHIPYNYFQNSNLSAWKVWYCLDNDTARFAWADDSVDVSTQESIYIRYGGGGGSPILHATCIRNSQYDTIVSNINYYCFEADGYPNKMYTRSATPSINDTVFSIGGGGAFATNFGTVQSYTPAHEGTGLPNGRGVIYRLIDEFNNDIKYDFKNIQFKRKLTNGQYDATNGTDTWCYTLNIWYNGMCQDASIVGNTLPNDEGFVNGVYDNKFGYATAYDLMIEGVNTFAFALGDSVVLSFDDAGYVGIKSNAIGNGFIFNTIGNGFISNIIGNYFGSNTIGNGFESNTIGNGFNTNTIGNDFCTNIIGTYFSGNTIGDDFNSNTIGNGFGRKTISNSTWYKNYGNKGVELATKDDIGNIETALNNI